MAKWLGIFLLFTLTLPLASKASGINYIDSLKRVERNSRLDSLRLDALSKLAIAHADSAYSTSIAYWMKALKVASKLKDRPQMAHIHHQIGYVLSSKGEFEEALLEYRNALSVHKFINNKKGIGQLYNDIGIIYKNWGRYEQALDSYLNGLRVFDEINDSQGIGMISNNIGQIYYYREDYSNAIEYFKRYLVINEQENRLRAVAGASNNIAAAFMELNNYNLALNYYNKAFNIYDSLGILIGVAILSDNIGILQTKLNNFQSALNYHFKALELFEQLKSKPRMTYTLKNIGFAYYMLGHYDKSIKYLLEAKIITSEYKQHEIEKEIFYTLSKVYEAISDYKESLRYHKLTSLVKDSLLSIETKEKLSSMELRYEAEKKDRELLFIQSKLMHQKTFKLIIVFIGFFFLILSIVLFRLNFNKNASIAALNRRNRFISKTLEHTVSYFHQKESLINNQFLEVIPLGSNFSTAGKSDHIFCLRNDLGVIISLTAWQTPNYFEIVKAFLRNEVWSLMELYPTNSYQEIIELIKNKFLYINDLLGIRLSEIDLNVLFIDCKEKTINFYGESCLVLFNDGLKTDKICNKGEIILKDSGLDEKIIYVLAHSPSANINQVMLILEKTILSTSNEKHNVQIDVINNALGSLSYSDSFNYNSSVFALKMKCKISNTNRTE